jgi:ribosomal-protein-alanine N-acetyltransferase
MKKETFELPDTMETDRLVMRSYCEEDGDVLYEASHRNAGHLARFEKKNVIFGLHDREQARSVARELEEAWVAHQYYFVGLFDKQDCSWVGQVYLSATDWDLPEFAIGFVADVDHEGMGYLTEAVTKLLTVLFTNLGVHRVIADCNEDNVRSRRLLDRCGFMKEGHLRQNKRNPDGSYHGDLLFGVLRQEFLDH